MKNKLCLLVVLILTSFYVEGQEDNGTVENHIIYEKCTFFIKTPPLRDLIKKINPIDDQLIHTNDKPKPYKKERYTQFDSLISDIGIPSTDGIDPALQTKPPSHSGTNFRTSVNIDGQNGGFPPDPTGAAGQNYYVQAVNNTFKVYNKDGTNATFSLSLNFFWERTGRGDPIVMYDHYAKRWFISQFWGDTAPDSDNGILIAVSETSDPLGAYYAYEYSYTLFPDYPKFSVWSNAYYMTANSTSADFSAFEREKMLVGDPTAGVIKMNFPTIPLYFKSIAPAYAEGAIPPEEYSPCYFFAVQDNSYDGVDADHIKIFKSIINWEDPWSSSLTVHQSLFTPEFNTVFSDTWDDITQKGTTQKLDAITGVFMYRVQYRRFDGYNVIMLCHTVDVDNTNRAGIRWYELRDANDGNWFIHQFGTYSPDATNSRWIPSISMNVLGNIALAYSFTGPNHYPGIRYTGRFKDDPLGEMTVQEQIAVEGVSPQITGRRYGDYSQMSLDPVDENLFWYTGEYIGPSGTRKTRIFAFSSWHLLDTEEAEHKQAYLKVYQPNKGILSLSWDLLSAEHYVNVCIFSADGKMIAQENMLNDGEEIIQIPITSAGIFVLQFQTKNKQISKKIYIGN